MKMLDYIKKPLTIGIFIETGFFKASWNGHSIVVIKDHLIEGQFGLAR